MLSGVDLNMGEIRVGTSGYKYDDWVGYFYPEGLSERDWLEFYARNFNTVEINSSFYTILPPSTSAHLVRKVPEGFDFAIKAHRSFTHDRTVDESILQSFQESLKPFAQSNKLGCVLLQFPWEFKYEPSNLDYLVRVCELLADYPLVVEFRNIGWIKDEVFEFLRDYNIGFCCVDEPRLKGLIPPIAVATSDIGYVRFHGRNKEKWWQHEHPWERYDYLYSEDEIAEWVPKIQRIAESTERCYVFFNNHYQGKAAINARMLMKLLSGDVG